MCSIISTLGTYSELVYRFYVFGIITFISQKSSLVIKIVDLLYWSHVIWITTIVFASVTESMSLLYICPITATVICEYLRNLSFTCLLCYDDLSKHAVSYRHLSLALLKPVGREAFPSDIFYLHSRITSSSPRVLESSIIESRSSRHVQALIIKSSPRVCFSAHLAAIVQSRSPKSQQSKF